MIIESSAYQTRYSAIEEVMKSTMWTTPGETRRAFIGGSDARIIMGSDDAALIRLWREKRGEVEPEDMSGNLIVQLGAATEALNRSWYERNTGAPTSNAGLGTRPSPGWWRPSTAPWRRREPFSSPSSCCCGHSLRKPPPKSIWPRSSTTCGSPT